MSSSTVARRECGVCWWVYDPNDGDEEAQIPPGVAFDDLPADYTCPRCQAPRERFVRPAGEDVRETKRERLPLDLRIARLVDLYRAINVRMHGLPIHNSRLEVEAIGFRVERREGEEARAAGVLVTPWFLSVIVFDDHVALPQQGESVDVDLKGGRFAAMASEMARSDDAIKHLAIPILSPVLELTDQAAARAMANAVVRLVLDGVGAAETTTRGAVASAPIGRRGLFGALFGGGASGRSGRSPEGG